MCGLEDLRRRREDNINMELKKKQLEEGRLDRSGLEDRKKLTVFLKHRI